MPSVTPVEPEVLLTATEVAELLQVHPKRVYRLVKEGLPGRRLGGQWRFSRSVVLEWLQRGGSAGPEALPAPAALSTTAPSVAMPAEARPPLLAANGDLAVELLLARLNASRAVLGFVQADRDQASRLLQQGAVLLAGSHGKGPPARLGGIRLARIHLVRREVGLVAARGRKVPRLAELGRLRFAGRPSSAGVAGHLERALREAGLDPRAASGTALALDSHRDVVLAVLRGDADAGLCTRAWAARAGLPFRLLAEEGYGLLVRAADLGDPRVVALCEVAQGEAYRAALGAVPGYDAAEAGTIRYDPEA